MPAIHTTSMDGESRQLASRQVITWEMEGIAWCFLLSVQHTNESQCYLKKDLCNWTRLMYAGTWVMATLAHLSPVFTPLTPSCPHRTPIAAWLAEICTIASKLHKNCLKTASKLRHFALMSNSICASTWSKPSDKEQNVCCNVVCKSYIFWHVCQMTPCHVITKMGHVSKICHITKIHIKMTLHS